MKTFQPLSFQRSYPSVLPINPTDSRPLWSIMIPTYNPEQFLANTLRSVLLQDAGTDLMQICVVDDCSEQTDLRSIIDDTDKNCRIDLLTNEKKLGLVGNWNRCLEHSKGLLVHILHQDDLVLPGFYERMAMAFKSTPEIGAAFCKHTFIDKSDEELYVSQDEIEKSGILNDFFERIVIRQRIQTPAIVVKRAVYEKIGGYEPKLVYSPDWDMWKRIAYYYPVWYETASLASFRIHPQSESSQLIQSGADIDDIFLSIRITSQELQDKNASKRAKHARNFNTFLFINNIFKLANLGEFKTAKLRLKVLSTNVGISSILSSLILAFRVQILQQNVDNYLSK